MEFQQNTNVYTSDGKGVGSLSRVVIETETDQVTYIVIKTGLLIKDDKVIPITNIASADQEKVTLNCTGEDIKEMSPLNVEVPVTGDVSSQGRAYDPLTGGAVPAPAVVTETRRTIPEELVALKEGAHVITENEKHVGSLDCVITEPETVKVTEFIVSQGLLSKTRKSIPIEWVKVLGEEEIHLTVEDREFNALQPSQE